MASARGEFSSRFGFVMAAAGSAVGLGNIWGFPTQAASNGGADDHVIKAVPIDVARSAYGDAGKA